MLAQVLFLLQTSCSLLPLRTIGFGFTSTEESQYNHVDSKKYTTLVERTCKNNSDELFHCTLYMLTLLLTTNAFIMRTLASTASILFSFLLPNSDCKSWRWMCHTSSIDCSHKPPMESFIALKKPLDNLKFQVRGSNRNCAVTFLLFQPVGAHMKNIFRHWLLAPEF